MFTVNIMREKVVAVGQKKEKKWGLISLASIPLIMTLGNSMLIPILPTIQKHLKISSLQVSMLITVYAVSAILLIPVAGYLSDRFGRKRVIIPSLVLAGLGGAVSGAASIWLEQGAYGWILVGRLLQGIGAAGAAPIVLPLVGDLFDREQDVSAGLGFIETSNTLGKVLSPILGAFIGGWHWYAPFLAIPLFCAVSIALVGVLVKPPKEREAEEGIKPFIDSIRKILREKGRWLYAIFAIGAVCMFVVFAFLYYLSTLLEDRHGMHGVMKGAVLAIPLAAVCIASYATGKGIGENKKRMKWVGFIGTAIVTASALAMVWREDLWYIVTTMAISGAGIGLVLPCLDAMITEGIEEERRGTMTSLYSSMRFIGVSVGPPFISLMQPTGRLATFLTIGGICATMCALALIKIRPREA